MARGWRVIDALGFDGVVGGKRGRLTLVSAHGSTQELPAEELAVVLLGGKASLDPTALHYAAKHDVAIVFADWRGVPYGGFFPWVEHTRVGARHLAQASASVPRRKNAWLQIVRAKIRGQARVLEAYDLPGANRLFELSRKVRSGDPGNVEGVAARLYWRAIALEEPTFARDQDGDDPLNGMLNYGYTVLRGFGIRAVLGAGLSPSLGLFHRGRSNYFNLVDDLIEPFRPAIDSTVVGLGWTVSLEDPEAKKAVVAAASQRFREDGTRIPAVLDDLAQQLGRYLEGEVDKLKVEAWAGPADTGVVGDDEER